MLAAFVCLGKDNLNVVFILADDMSRDTWGAYGGKECRHLISTVWPRTGPVLTGPTARWPCAPFRQELYSGRSPWRTGTLPNHSKSVAGTKSVVHYLTSWLSGCSARKISRRSERMLSLRAARRRQQKGRCQPQTLTKARAFLDDCKKSDNPFASSSVPMIPRTLHHGRYLRLRCKEIDRPPYWVDTPQLREEMVKYYAEITNFDNLVGMMRKELEKKALGQHHFHGLQ